MPMFASTSFCHILPLATARARLGTEQAVAAWSDAGTVRTGAEHIMGRVRHLRAHMHELRGPPITVLTASELEPRNDDNSQRSSGGKWWR